MFLSFPLSLVLSIVLLSFSFVLPKPWDAILAALLGVTLPMFILNTSGSLSFIETSGSSVTPVLFRRDTSHDAGYIASITRHLVSGRYHHLLTSPGTDNCLLSSRGVFLLKDEIDRSYLIGTVSLSLESECWIDNCIGFIADDYVQPQHMNLQSSGVEFSGFSDVLKSANLALRLSCTFTDIRFVSSHPERIVNLMKTCFESKHSIQTGPSEIAFGGRTILLFSYASCTEDLVLFMNHCSDAPDRTTIAVVLPSLSSEHCQILTSYRRFTVRSAFRLAGSDPVSTELMLVLYKIGKEPVSAKVLTNVALASEKIRFFTLNMMLYEPGDLAKIGLKRFQSYTPSSDETEDFIPFHRRDAAVFPSLVCFELPLRESTSTPSPTTTSLNQTVVVPTLPFDAPQTSTTNLELVGLPTATFLSASMRSYITPSQASEEGKLILLPARRSTGTVVLQQPVEVPPAPGIQNAMSFNTNSTAPGFNILNSIRAFIDHVSRENSVFPFTSTILLDVFRNFTGESVYIPTKNCRKMSVEYFAQRIRSKGEPLDTSSSFELAQLLRHISHNCPDVPEDCTSSAVLKWRSFLCIMHRDRSPIDFTPSETTMNHYMRFLESYPSWRPNGANHTLVFPVFEI
jgi:hypothetical protein